MENKQVKIQSSPWQSYGIDKFLKLEKKRKFQEKYNNFTVCPKQVLNDK